MTSKMGDTGMQHGIKDFIEKHYRHFNAAALRDAARAWVTHHQGGKKMFLTMAGAMSTAEIGVSLAELIRRGLVQGISCTGANLEEDVFNLVAHEFYERVPNFRNISPAFEEELAARGMNRVTDTCIPEHEAIRRIEKEVLALWQKADQKGERYFPHEYMYQLLLSGVLKDRYQIPLEDSWLYAAAEKNIPIFVPGWEDSTLGNIFVSHVMREDLSGYHIMRSGPEYMGQLANWYRQTAPGVGFFQLGGGIAGDFPICVVPMLAQDMGEDTPTWSYFCQISDSTTSYGSYSGAIPSEKISWGKLKEDCPMFVIESDASIVAPLVFSYVLEACA
jgi:deoxyhypusine synthase